MSHMLQHVLYFQEECLVLACVLRTSQKMKFVNLDGTNITLCGFENTCIENHVEIVHDVNFFF